MIGKDYSDPILDEDGAQVGIIDTAWEREQIFLRDVVEEIRKLKVRAAARQAWAAELAATNKPVDAGLLEEILARPHQIRWAVNGLLPTGGRMLIAAQRKTGKTIAGLNYARCRLTGEHLFGRFDTQRLDGRVAYLNYEVTGEQLARWAEDLDIPPTRLYLVNLRGRRNLLADEEGREELADLLTKAETQNLIIDPFGRAYTGQSQNDSAEVTPWLIRLDELASNAKCEELVLTAHAGWDGERTRGSSALEDWPDSIVTMTRDPDDPAKRFLRAEGRDVEIDEDELSFDPNSRLLRLTDTGSRKQKKTDRALEQAMTDILIFVAANPDCSGEDILNGVEGRAVTVRGGRNKLVAKGLLEEALRSGRGGGKCYNVPNHKPRPTPSHSIGTESLTPSPRLYKDGVSLDEERGVSPSTSEPESTPSIETHCPRCGWGIDTTGHEANCLTPPRRPLRSAS